MLAVVLTAVAVHLAGPTVTVQCHAPADQPRWGRVVGWTYYGYPQEGEDTIFLRYCLGTVDRARKDVDTLAHELLHVEHPDWPHPKVYGDEHAYGAIVLKTLPKERVERLRRLLRPTLLKTP